MIFKPVILSRFVHKAYLLRKKEFGYLDILMITVNTTKLQGIATFDTDSKIHG